MSRFRKILFALILAIPIVLLFLILSLQTSFAEKRILAYIERYAYDTYKIRLHGEKLDLHLFPLNARVDGVRIYGGKTNDRIFLDAKFVSFAAPYSILWSNDTVVDTFEINTPALDAQNLPEPQIPKTQSKGTFEIRQVVVTGGSLQYANYQLRDIILNAQLEPDAIRLNQLRANIDQIELKASGLLATRGGSESTIDYQAAGPAETLAKFAPDIPRLAGQFKTSGKILGRSGNYQVDGVLDTRALSVDGSAPMIAHGTYQIDTSSKDAPYNAQLTWQNLPLQQLLRRFAASVPPVAAVSHGTLEYHGTKDFLKGRGTVNSEIEPARLKGFPVAGHVQGNLGGGVFHLEPSQIRFSSSRMDLSGDLTTDSMNVKVHADIPRPADLSSLYRDLKKVPGSYTIDSVITGPYKNLRADATVNGQSREMNLQAELSYWMNTNNVHIVLNGNADAMIINRFYPAGVEGRLNVTADVSGNLSHPAGTAEIRGESLRVRDIVIDTAYIQMNGDGRAMAVTAEIPKYGLTADGSYRFSNKQYQLNVHTKDLDIAQLSPFLPPSVAGLSGNITADLNASGNAARWKNSNAELVIQKASLARNDLHADIQTGNIRLAQEQLTVAFRIVLPDGSLDVNGIAPITETGMLKLHATGQANLAMLSLFTDQVNGTGTVNLDVTVNGTPAKPVFAGRAASQSFNIQAPAKHIQLTQANLDAEFSGQQLALQTNGLLNGSPLQVKGAISFAGSPGELSLSLQSFPLSTLAPTSNVTGHIGITLQAHGTGIKPANWSGDLTIEPSQVTLSGTPFESEPMHVHMDIGRVELKTVHIRAAQMLDATAGGVVNLRTGEIAGSFQGSTDLVLLTEFVDNLRAGGKVDANVQIAGNLAHPTFQGKVQINNGTIRVIDSPILLERVNLTIPLDKDRIKIGDFTAKMGGGNITGGGVIELNNWQPGHMDLWVKAQKVGMNYPTGLHSQVSADLTLVSLTRDYLLGGKVIIDRSVYRDDIDPRQRLVNTLLSEKTALSPDISSRSRIKLDVQVESLDNFKMRNNLGKVQAAANLRITGNLMEPRVSGRVRLASGSKITFQGNDFDVQRGTVDFYGRRKITPVLDVQLFTIATDDATKDQYEITIPISGPVDDLDDRDPESSPPLDPNQIYFLLLTGRVDAQLSRAGSRFFQQQLASYVAGRVFSDVQRKVASAFGLQKVEIQPEAVSSETTPGAKLVLGKDFNSSLSLVYSTSLTGSREQTWIANYVIRRNMNVRFVDQDDGTYTANIRHLVRFGTGRTMRSLQRNIQRPKDETIKSIKIANESPLNEPEIRDKLGLKEGDRYDYWNVQDKVDRIKQLLQDRGYLFPVVMVDEQDTGNGALALLITVTATQPADMVFEGDVGKKQIDKYKQWWREGFSETAVLELIGDDIEQSYWFKGYHNVNVKQSTEKTGGVTHYHFAISTGPKFATVRITFKGAMRYPAEDLQKDLRALYPSREQMNSEAIHHFSSMEKKISALYVKKGYLETKAKEGGLNEEGVARLSKEIVVNEGPQSRISDILIRGGEAFPADLQEQLKIKIGGLYDPQALAEDEMTIQDYYESKGYRKFQIQSEVRKPEGMTDLTIEYQVQMGGIARVASIEVHGLQHSKEDFILKRLGFKVGDIVTHDKLAKAQKSLYDLRIFHQATVQAKETPTPDEYDVVADLAEMKHYELTYGFRYDTEKGVGGEVQLADLSLFGTGQTISAYTRVNRFNQLFRAVYHSPTLSGLKWKSLFSGSYETGELTLREGREGNQLSLAEGQRYLVTFQRQRKIRDPFVLVTGYEYEFLRSRPRNALFSPFDSFKISRIVGTVFEDTRDDPLNAMKGTFLSVDVQYAPGFLASDVNYVKNYTQWYRFQRLGNVTWASAVRAGMSTHLANRLVTERFFAGGSYSIRGFPRDQVGPKDIFGNPIGGEAVFIVNQELRIPVWKWFGAAVFYDAGNVYDTSSNFNPLRLRHTLGFGLRFDSPFGVARLDLGINPANRLGEPRTVIHFGLGQAF